MMLNKARAILLLAMTIGLLASAGGNRGGGYAAAPLSAPRPLPIIGYSDQPAPTPATVMIRLPYASFDPLQGEPPLDPRYPAPSTDDSTPRHYLVQMQPTQLAVGLAAVQEAGGSIIEPIPDWAYIVAMNAPTAAVVSKLTSVRWVGRFQPAYKLESGLAEAKGQLKLRVIFFPDLHKTDAATQTAGRTPFAPTPQTLPVASLPALAADENVRWIERQPSFSLNNDQMRQISGVARTATDLGLYGAGQVIALADSGLDTGNPSTLLADFRGRVLAAHALGRANDWSDPDGHGTHTAGTALGNGLNSGSNPAAHNYAGSFAGIAPEAQLVMQSILDSGGGLGGLPPDLNTLFQQAYDDGARVHSDSWGASGAGEYTSYSQQADQFVWNHPDMNVVFSAGNDGVDLDRNGVIDGNSLSSPATAKNVLSVGASESLRSGGGYSSYTYAALWPSDYHTNPIAADYPSNNSSGMAAFSSRGPSADGRIGPLISNPGTDIISARSQVSGNGGWGGYNQWYMYDGGTSMAAPGVAGAAALVREFYSRYAGVNPSAALVRATLLDGAFDMNPGQYGAGTGREMTARPNNVEGWGRLDLANALDLPAPRQLRFADNATGLANNASIDYGVDVTDAGYPLHATLAWADYPGYGLIDDLDLSLMGPDGTTYWGNAVSGGDRHNNTETVDLATAPVGHYRLHIHAYRVQAPSGVQPFAIAAHAAMGGVVVTPTPTLTPSPLPCGVFLDVPTSNTFYQYIHDLACAGVVSGTSYGYYSPNLSATRAQFSKMAVKGFGFSLQTPSGGPTFADVPTSYWAWPYIETAAANRLVSGTGGGNFSPDASISRAQTVAMIVRARGWPRVTPATPSFSDVPTSHWAYTYIETAYVHGAISGVGGGLFAPDAAVQRGQLAKLLYNGIHKP